jgi:hypothetical protein
MKIPLFHYCWAGKEDLGRTKQDAAHLNGFWFGPSVNSASGNVGFGGYSRFGICKLGELWDWHSILAGVTVDWGITDGRDSLKGPLL